jgi:hypothetical protein
MIQAEFYNFIHELIATISFIVMQFSPLVFFFFFPVSVIGNTKYRWYSLERQSS